MKRSTRNRIGLGLVVVVVLVVGVLVGVPKLFTTTVDRPPATPTEAEEALRASIEAKVGPVYIRRHPWRLALSPVTIECDPDPMSIKRDRNKHVTRPTGDLLYFHCVVDRDGVTTDAFSAMAAR